MKSIMVLLVLMLFACGEVTTKKANDDGTDGNVCTQRVFKDEVTNARDLGGWPVPCGSIACRKIFRGGALTHLSNFGCTEFASLGIRTIVDLREQDVQDSMPPPSCTTLLAKHIPAAMPKLLPDTPDHYLMLLKETDAIRRVYSVLGDEDAYPIYIHCEIGRDRASFVTALVLLTLGAERQTVMDEFLLSEEAGVLVKAESMNAVLDEINLLFGIEAFLTSLGVERTNIGVLLQTSIQE